MAAPLGLREGGAIGVPFGGKRGRESRAGARRLRRGRRPLWARVGVGAAWGAIWSGKVTTAGSAGEDQGGKACAGADWYTGDQSSHVACLVGRGAFLGQRERVPFQDGARATSPRVVGVGAGAEAVSEPREDLYERVRHEQLPRLDSVLRCQLMELVEAPAAREVCERVGVAVSVGGAVEGSAVQEIDEVQVLHVFVARAVVVEDVERRCESG